MHALGDDPSVITGRRDAGDHHVFKLDLKILDASAVAIGSEELELGLGDCLPCGTRLKQDGGRKIGQLVEADLVNIGFAAGVAAGCGYGGGSWLGNTPAHILDFNPAFVLVVL